MKLRPLVERAAGLAGKLVGPLRIIATPGWTSYAPSVLGGPGRGHGFFQLLQKKKGWAFAHPGTAVLACRCSASHRARLGRTTGSSGRHDRGRFGSSDQLGAGSGAGVGP